MTEVMREVLAKGQWRWQLCGQNVQTGRKFTQVEPDMASVTQLQTNVLQSIFWPKITLAASL